MAQLGDFDVRRQAALGMSDDDVWAELESGGGHSLVERIILHIGAPKCGSTFVQKVMLKNRDLLSQNGVFYPHNGSQHPGNASDLSMYDEAALEDMTNQGVSTLVLSHEDLLYRPLHIDEFAKLVESHHAEVHLLAFVRPMSEIIFGDYSQHMKQYFSNYLSDRVPYNGESFEEFAVRRVAQHKMSSALSKWQSRINSNSFQVVSHKKIIDTYEALLPFGIEWTLPQEQANASLRVEDCERLAALMQDRKRSDDEIKKVFHKCFHASGQPDAGRTPERVKLIEAAAKVETEWLNHTFSVRWSE